MPSRNAVIVGVTLGQLVRQLPSARFGLAPGRVRRAAWARALRLSFERLGPAFVKLGQLISVRPDEFSAELVAEMQSMQDAVPPIPASAIRSVIRSEFAAEPEELFASFDDTPLAAASIAQVHRATLAAPCRPVWGDVLPAGAEVVVKVVRPGAAESIRGDVAIVRRLATRLAGTRFARRFDPVALVDEFAETVDRELDLRKEGRFADRFVFDFRDDDKVVAPRIVWSRTTAKVLTMEYITGWRLSDLETARAAGVDCKGLAIHGATAFMRQVFVYGRYHADLHPANIFVTPENTIAYLDFGIVGYLTPEERMNITQVMAALVYRDPDRALRYSEKLGVHVPPEHVEPVRKGLGELLDGDVRPDGTRDFAHFGLGFLRLLGAHDIAIPGGYGLLIKSLATVEGVARALYPEIDIVSTAQPFTTRILGRAMGDPVRVRERMPAAVRAALRVLTE
ncbi:ABC1 kinase family protein [Anaerosoma tenue]|uniref:ABC1 kinase family protein n=1 Tax=Anaerosoma tenue TaxID=2933588 RepID=UPI002260F761|nr:AarF/UbiB family protein [Anaerosoma tenue]MCK8115399.1 AarF/UbiB family protein [Anaerosoma tenue]